jgi:hypothetical protein
MGRRQHLLLQAPGHDLAVVDEDDVVGDLERAGDVVADHDAGDTELALRGKDHLVDLVGRDWIESGGRLVVQDDGRFERDGPGQRHTLSLTAGDLRR